MELSNDRVRALTRRLLTARMRLLCNNGFYGLLLMHIRMGLDDRYDTAWTDGKEHIWFYPDFLDQLSETELDFVLMHELLHIVLEHSGRRQHRVEKLYNLAADIVINSNILRSNWGNEETISLRKYGGVQVHTVSDASVMGTVGQPQKKSAGKHDPEEGWEYTVEELYHRLYGYVVQSSRQDMDDDDALLQGMNDNAADEGDVCNDTYEMRGTWDVHLPPQESDQHEAEDMDEIWDQRMRQACETIKNREQNKQRGMLPAFAERYLLELMKPQVDWRQILAAFVQEEINDYSFEPPDRRMQDSPFFLPDFNEKTEHVRKILFMIDTSGSMSEREITACYSEIKGAIDQYDGRLEGWLGFFDAQVTKPEPFAAEEEFMVIRPVGGGGTSFEVIFRYVREEMAQDPPASIVILTDGYAAFPQEETAMDIPVLWILNNESITPPWGVIARIDLHDN